MSNQMVSFQDLYHESILSSHGFFSYDTEGLCCSCRQLHEQ